MYNVGQVLYVVIEKKHTILPVRVAEQIVRRTIDGETISYLVEVPGKNQQTVALSNLGTKHFSSIEEVKGELLANAEKAIEAMSEKAKSIAQEFFHHDVIEVVNPPSTDLNNTTPTSTPDEDSAKVDLGDGVVANVDLSSLANLGGN